MMMGIDLNMAEEEEEEEGEKEDEYSSSPPAAAAAAPGVCMELWHACAGPLISLPKKGSVVVYLPQGHLEHLRSSATEGGGGGFSYSYNVPPPHVFCRVIHVNLHADAATDEVFAQLSLVGLSQDAEQQLGEGEVEGEVGEGEDEEEFNGVSSSRSSLMPHMFCKTLTASDTSTHGGFSVPRRAAEDCFPPLDYNKQRPSQELIAKDLHGTEWKFRHIYRGQPRRHLLTTGWSSFVNKKKLVSGDAVLFLRGNNGELRLGVRRAAQLKSSIPCSVRNQNTNAGTLAAVADALSSKSLFNIFYSPRASPSEFIIPYPKFTKSLTYSFSIGTRFKMRYESEDAGERRYTGWITGVSDMDPIRWTGSKWRCLVVRWDDDVDASRQNRVSPWEIEPTGSISGSIGLSSSISKRTKVCLPSGNPDFPHPNGSGILDLGESARFPKVLQGQELFGFRSPYGGAGVTSHYPEMRRNTTSINYGIPSDGRGSGARVPVGGSEFSYKCTGFGESVRFNEVLQGQEIFPLNPPCTGSHAQNCGFGFVEDGRRCSAPSQGYGGLALPSTTSAQVSSPSSVLMFQPTSQLLCQQSIYISNNCNKGDNDRKVASLLSPTPYIGSRFNKEQSEQRAHVEQNHGRNSCKLFGFSLTERIPVLNGEDDSTSPALPTVIEANFGTSSLPTEPHTPNSSIGRSCTAKVHKQGSLVGKVIDLSKFDGYDGLIRELERLFDMQGLLNDKNQNKWHVVYTDDENDMMLVGDDPWQEFCNVASRILIYTHDEGMIACRMTSDGCS